jgi:hypothetical protein
MVTNFAMWAGFPSQNPLRHMVQADHCREDEDDHSEPR